MGYNDIGAFDLQLPVAEPKFDSKRSRLKKVRRLNVEWYGELGCSSRNLKRRKAQINEAKEKKGQEGKLAGLDE